MLRFFVVALLSAAVAVATVNPKTSSDSENGCSVPVKPMGNFDAEQMFNGKHWFVTGGPAAPQFTCAYSDPKFNANNNTVSSNEYLTYKGKKSKHSYLLDRDEKRPAVFLFTDTANNFTVQMAILDTDYVKYALVSQCVQGSGALKVQSVLILSRTVSPPDNYNDLKAEAKGQGYPVDEQHLSLADTSACPKQ